MNLQTETKPYDTINVTPMLDLAYVLLVVFILMTTATVQGLPMSLPKPSNKPSTERKELRIVQVAESGSVSLNGAAVRLPELASQLATIKELAAAEKINSSYVSRVLRLTLPAPDVIEAMLDGLQPEGMTLPILLEPFPVEWVQQRGSSLCRAQEETPPTE